MKKVIRVWDERLDRMRGVEGVEYKEVESRDIVYLLSSLATDTQRVMVVRVHVRDIDDRPTGRLLEASSTAESLSGSLSSSNDNVINIKPDAVFGLGLSLFLFFVLYNGFMCLFDVKVPRSFPSKPFKFGREL